MGDYSTQQAWLFAMTSGLASALGGATLYLDPLLHALGAPSSFNILDSHTVLSALLAGASGIMAYTSIGVLTKESMEYLSELTNWPLVAKYPGAMVAILFVTGAHLNLLLARLVTYLTPQDSPIKHTCASHPPSPNAELHFHEGSIGDNRTSLSANILDSRPIRHNDTERQPLLSRSSGTTQHCPHIVECSPSEPAHSHGSCTSGKGTSLCEYACVKPNCFSPEHCHITPLYPHIHVHAHAGASSTADASIHSGTDPHTSHHSHSVYSMHADHNHGSAALDHHHHLHSHLHMYSSPNVASCSDDDIPNRLIAAHSVEPSIDHHYLHECSRREIEPEVQFLRSNDSTTSQISSKHHRLLMHVGLQTAVAIALHKIPEGLIIFLSRQASPKLGLSVAASLFFHNLPEGLMLALPLYLATGRRHMAFIVAALMGAIPPALGAALGMLVVGNTGGQSGKNTRLPAIFGAAFGITAGMMCMVSLNGMLPTARIYDKSGNVVAWCFALGVAAMIFANSILE